jgi:hypothetical protein
MPLFDMAVLALIVAVFVTFGVVLAWVSWYCRNTARRDTHLHEPHALSMGLIADDD